MHSITKPTSNSAFVSRSVILSFVFAAVLWLGPMIGEAYANYGYGSESQVQSFFEGTAGFLVKTVGTGVFILGLIVAGIKISAGDQNGLRNAVMVMIGGAVIFLAKPLVGILSRLSGSN